MDAERDPVRTALETVRRADFLPAASRINADFDGPIPIGHGQTNSQPLTVEAMLRLLHVEPGQRILDVGSGSGWTTALLAQLTGPAGRVYGVEIEPELATWGAGNITDHKNASIVRAVPGVLGLPDTAPYDRILVSAEPPSVPQELVDQLADPGIMVIPVRGVMLRVVLNAGELTTTQHGYYRFVPLR